jgi:hypothetical protein
MEISRHATSTTIAICFIDAGGILALEITNHLLGFAGGHPTSYVSFSPSCAWFTVSFPTTGGLARRRPWSLDRGAADRVGKTVFVFYIENVAHLEAVYGSVSSIIVLLPWLYFASRLLLLGSELVAVHQEDLPPHPA